MRIFLLALSVLLFCSCASFRDTETANSVTIKEIEPRYMEAEDFKRIKEYFTGAENKGNRIILRTTSGERAGYYFIVFLDKKAPRLPSGAEVVAEFITDASPEPREYRFELPSSPPSTKEILVGLTGEENPGRESIPSAWRFTLEDGDGEILDQRASYLWKL
ncbi:MAG: hypothetical protein ACLFS4_06335 [Opitutales bacterium]